MKDRRVVVTGGAGDIGGAVAARMAREGARVVTWDVKKGVSTDGIHQLICDVTDMDAVRTAVKSTGDLLGAPDVIVNAVGIGQHSGFLDTPAEDWDRIVGIDLLGAVNVIRGVLPGMVERGSGTIVNICSIWSKTPGVDRSAYISAKWGLLGATKCLAEEYREAGITVCAVSPGPVLTTMTRDMVPPGAPPWLEPDDVAQVVVNVAAGGRTFTGSEIEVFGSARPSGMSAKA